MEAAQLRTALGLLALVAALAVAAWWQGSRDTWGAASGDALVWDVWRKDIERVGVELPDGSSWLLDVGGGAVVCDRQWVHRADPAVLDRILDRVEEARRGVAVDLDPEDAGLDPGVRLLVRQHGQDRFFFVGDDAPVGHRTYVRTDAGIFAASGHLNPWLRRSCEEMRATAEGEDGD